MRVNHAITKNKRYSDYSLILDNINRNGIDYFQVRKTLTFKKRLRQKLCCENEFYLVENKNSFSSQWLRT